MAPSPRRWDRGVTIEPTTLQTRRLILRPPRSEDVEVYYAFARDPSYAFFGFREDVTPTFVAEFLAPYLQSPWRDQVMFVIMLGGALIGSVQMEIDWANQLGTLGYGLAPSHWGCGYAAEAAEAVLGYGFEVLQLEKVWARADPRNHASVRVLEKLGMSREGVLREHFIRRGERVDRVCYGILRREWDELRDREAGADRA